MRLRRCALVATLMGLPLVGCNGGEAADGGVEDMMVSAAEDMAPSLVIPEAMQRFCEGRDPSLRTAGKVGELKGRYKGVITGAQQGQPWDVGALEMIKVIPRHLFLARTLRVNFGRGSGTVRLHLVNTFGRSYPGIFPGADPADLPDFIEPADLIPPVEVEVSSDQARPDNWLEIPIPPTLLAPTQHYALVYEHVQAEPYLATEEIVAGDLERSLIFLPYVDNQAYGLQMNYRMELGGDELCVWSAAERLFEARPVPFGDGGAQPLAIADVDHDGIEDVVAGKDVWVGDGKGGFKPIGFEAFPGTVGQLVFGDLDNDGDVDAVSGLYVGGDDDGDGSRVTSDSPAEDCDDTDPAVKPGRAEVMGNLKDDNCDGVADDGKDAADHDQDGASIAQGDCDDTAADIHPGAPELLDKKDNDCDGKVDEDFTSAIYRNDGKGHFTLLPNPQVQVRYTTTSIALGDGNGDGLLDFYVGNWLYHYPDFPTEPGQYYVNQGGAVFTESLAAAGMKMGTPRPPYGATWADWNNDGLLDLYVSNYNLRDNCLWKNLGGNKFVDVALDVGAAHDDIPSGMAQYPGGHSYGSAFGDFDNDGDLDLYVPNISHPRVQPWSDPSVFLVNQGPGGFSFESRRRQMGMVYDEGQDQVVWVDYDNDMDLDLFVHGIYPTHYSLFYRNDGDHFTDVTYETGTAQHGGGGNVFLDVDGDGDMDLIASQSSLEPPITLFVNRAARGNHFLELDLQGTKSNHDGAGARVTLTAGGVTQIREVPGGTNRPNQGSRIVHFGLGPNTAIESLTVRWIGGAKETISGAKADSIQRIVEGSGKATAR